MPGTEHATHDADPATGQRSSGRRAWVVALVVVGALVLVLAVADVAARNYAERNVAEEAQRAAGLAAPPEVEFPGGSFLWQAAGGGFDSVHIRADEATEQGIRGEDIVVRLDRVAVPRTVLLGRGGTIAAEGGTARALVPFASLEERVAQDWREVDLAAAGSAVEVTGELEVLGRTQPLTVTVEVELDGSTLVLTPVAAAVSVGELDLADLRRVTRRLGIESPLDGVPVELAGLPPEVDPRRVQVTERGLAVEAGIKALELETAAR